MGPFWQFPASAIEVPSFIGKHRQHRKKNTNYILCFEDKDVSSAWHFNLRAVPSVCRSTGPAISPPAAIFATGTKRMLKKVQKESFKTAR